MQMHEGQVLTNPIIAVDHPEAAARLRGTPPDDPTRRASARWLRGIATERLSELREREARLRKDFDEPDRAGAVDRGAMLEGLAGTTFVRYMRMHDLMYFRSHDALMKGRREGRKTGQSPGQPNEANYGGMSSPFGGKQKVYGGGPGPGSGQKSGGKQASAPFVPNRDITPNASLSKSFAEKEAKVTPPEFVKASGVEGSDEMGRSDGGSASVDPKDGGGPIVPIVTAG